VGLQKTTRTGSERRETNKLRACQGYAGLGRGIGRQAGNEGAGNGGESKKGRDSSVGFFGGDKREP